MAVDLYRKTRTNVVYINEVVQDGVLFVDKLADGEQITSITDMTISDDTVVEVVEGTLGIVGVIQPSDTVGAFFRALAAGTAIITFTVETTIENHQPVGYIKWTVKPLE